MGLVTLLACGLIAVCSSSAVAQDAAATYKAKCAMCHGADGKGGQDGNPRLRIRGSESRDRMRSSTDIITKGKGKMPSYDGKLKDADIKGLVAYIRSLAK